MTECEDKQPNDLQSNSMKSNKKQAEGCEDGHAEGGAIG